MATTDDLIISIRADVNQLNTQLNDVNNRLRDTERNGNKAGDALKDMAKGLLALFGAMGGLEKLIQVNREFGILKAGLETATGSLEGATEAFGALQQFAQETPYALSQAVDGFTKLVNLGLTPSERALKSYGDTSAALGKDLSQMIEAVADAATGEFERLKEFGIKSKNQGDTIAFTFKGTTETVKNNAAAIEEYLIKMGEINFDGAMKKRMDSLDGAISNLGDTWDNFFYQLGQAGATDVLKDTFVLLGDAISEVNAMLSSGEMQGYVEAIGISFEGLVSDVDNAMDAINTIIASWSDENQNAISELVGFFKDAFLELPQNVRAFAKLAGVEFAALVVDAEIYGRKIANFLNPLSPTYDLQKNLDESVRIYQESIAEILAERDKTTADASARKEKAQNDRQLSNLVNEFVGSDNTGDRLAKFGIKREAPKDQADDKKAAQEAKKLEQLKKNAQDYLNVIAESNMSQEQLEVKHYNESLAKLKGFLDAGAITREQYQEGVLNKNEAFNNRILDDIIEQFAKEEALALEQQTKEDANRTKRIEDINAIIEETKNAGMTELELMDAQHAAKMNKLAELMVGEEQFKEELRQAALDAEAQHQAKRLDLMLGTGSKMQDMSKAFQKGQLQGALSFFAADFGGMSQHSRKMFELTKAARLAEAAISIPSTVMKAFEYGTGIGGPVVGAAFGAAALATQLGQLRAIQSASFGGGSSGGGGGSASSASSATSSSEAQAPLQQRFVNINLSGADNTMYSKSSVRDLITRINDEVKDGAVLRVV